MADTDARKRPVLIVEDEFVNREILKAILSPEYEVFCAETGTEALRILREQAGRLSQVLLDLNLPDMNGLVRELDNYVWREAAAQIRRWKDAFGRAVPVSINVSRVDMQDPELEETLRRLVEDNGLDFGDLHLEVTESAYTQDSEMIIRVVERLREQGFKIEMDDFGSGYSSLNMITQLPIDALKLGMMFIRNAFRENGNTGMLKVTLDISRYLNVPMIAEGVETEEQMLTMKELGCDIVQGYYFAKPMPAEEFSKYLK